MLNLQVTAVGITHAFTIVTYKGLHINKTLHLYFIGAFLGCETLPLYDGAELNQGSSLWAIMDFCITHKLSYKAQSSLIELINLHCPSPNRLV